jgi:hypothetical protein
VKQSQRRAACQKNRTASYVPGEDHEKMRREVLEQHGEALELPEKSDPEKGV